MQPQKIKRGAYYRLRNGQIAQVYTINTALASQSQLSGKWMGHSIDGKKAYYWEPDGRDIDGNTANDLIAEMPHFQP